MNFRNRLFQYFQIDLPEIPVQHFRKDLVLLQHAFPFIKFFQHFPELFHTLLTPQKTRHRATCFRIFHRRVKFFFLLMTQLTKLELANLLFRRILHLPGPRR